MKNFFIVIAIIFLCSCISKGGTKDDASKYKVGDIITVDLDANMTTGYTWIVKEDYDSNIIELLESDYKVLNPDLDGSPGVMTFKFKVTGRGKTKVTLLYLRPWVEYSTLEEKDIKTHIIYVESD